MMVLKGLTYGTNLYHAKYKVRPQEQGINETFSTTPN